jgi:hypothetical protein
MIGRDPRILSTAWMLIERQATTNFGGRLGLLASAPDGSLVTIELTRDRAPRSGPAASARDFHAVSARG